MMLLPLSSFAFDKNSYTKGCVDTYEFLIAQAGHKLDFKQRQDIIYGCLNAAMAVETMREEVKAPKNKKPN